MNPLIQEITSRQWIDGRGNFNVGDGVRVHVKIREGDKERIQIFSGIVIAKKHSGISKTFTVRRVIAGEGVERIFPVHSPNIACIEVERVSVPVRAKLYYIRQRVGKDAMKVKEKKH
ncbi:MAG: 50S ribosomal protein L19 [Puniceicoccales bacterium]|jgi:large subunit ribosomal protein L19|nr:50S ribosomal protein L19 [Puniceicoccales bacterium]